MVWRSKLGADAKVPSIFLTPTRSKKGWTMGDGSHGPITCMVKMQLVKTVQAQLDRFYGPREEVVFLGKLGSMDALQDATSSDRLPI